MKQVFHRLVLQTLVIRQYVLLCCVSQNTSFDWVCRLYVRREMPQVFLSFLSEVAKAQGRPFYFTVYIYSGLVEIKNH